ncbi:hypothetical protein HYT60_01495 [Candidatus Woesebacteria bacterium]|nr:hypothetical protein [Candidatus Woesebacteria bacterium]
MGGKLPTQTYFDIEKRKVDFDFLRNRLKIKHLEAKKVFAEKYPHAQKFLAKKGVEIGKLREHSAKIIGAGALTGTLLLASPASEKALLPPEERGADLPQKLLVDTLGEFLPKKTRLLTRPEEKFLEQAFASVMGVKARATLEGEHLNTTYGLIGAEQHLKRFPGDSVANHKPFLKEGIAPGLGAWGYFAPSKDKMTRELEETERWYAVVQTLYLPDWNSRQPYLRDWYKYRKVLIVNTENGNAVVAAIADSGPAAWTGKHFGGSPEVMEYLGGPRYKKGPVVLFFVDDPENKVPLGPVDYNKQSLLLRSKINLSEI